MPAGRRGGVYDSSRHAAAPTTPSLPGPAAAVNPLRRRSASAGPAPPARPSLPPHVRPSPPLARGGPSAAQAAPAPFLRGGRAAPGAAQLGSARRCLLRAARPGPGPLTLWRVSVLCSVASGPDYCCLLLPAVLLIARSLPVNKMQVKYLSPTIGLFGFGFFFVVLRFF